jgi:murein L,D-transpeptidase YafK
MKTRGILSLLATTFLLIGCSHPKSLPIQTADKIIVVKSQHAMTLYAAGHPLKTYQVALGRGPGHAKQQQGDHETPEGNYLIDAKNAHSRFHLALHVSYPNAADKARAKALGKDPGGDIMIHGIETSLGWIGSLHRSIDWTDGCIAVTNSEMDEIWETVPVGSKVEIRP